MNNQCYQLAFLCVLYTFYCLCEEIQPKYEVQAEKYGMVVSMHSVEEEEDEMDELVRNHKDLTIVAAHPGEYHAFMRHLERMKISENYYLDLSGYGMFRHGMLRYGIDKFGAERFVFGSDYPTCNPGMYIGGVLLDNLITDAEKEKIFATILNIDI